MESLNIAYTVECSERPSLTEWLAEFKVGLMAPKSIEGKEKAKSMMKLWGDGNGNVDFSKIKLLAMDK